MVRYMFVAALLFIVASGAVFAQSTSFQTTTQTTPVITWHHTDGEIVTMEVSPVDPTTLDRLRPKDLAFAEIDLQVLTRSTATTMAQVPVESRGLSVSDLSLAVGQSRLVNVDLSKIDTGFSGFAFRVSPQGTGVQVVDAVNVSGWGLFDFNTNTGVVSAVDLGRIYEPGDHVQPLVSLDIMGVEAGTFDIVLEAVNVDDDNGDDVPVGVTFFTVVVS